MLAIYFEGFDRRGARRACHFCGDKLEYCLDALSLLVTTGWRITKVTLRDEAGKTMSLPAEAFDGVFVSDPIMALQQVWEDLLVCQA